VRKRIIPCVVTRRTILQASATTGAALAAGSLATPAVLAASPTLKIGYVTPATGPLAGFAEADDFNIGLFRTLLKDGLKVDRKTYTVEILVKDSQSNPNRAAQVAKDLIVQDKINIMIVGGTPETCVPVSTQCEIEEVPCISANCPWQAWFFGRQSNLTNPQPFNYTYHFFWGLEDIIAAYTNMWGQLSTNKQVGGLFPNDVDGNAWGDPKLGLPPALGAKGYKITDPGRYQDLSDDFTAQITAFKKGNAQIVTGVMLTPDFTTFWNQAQQQGFRPKIATVGKAILFPVSVQTLGKSGHNLSCEVWWGPDHPFKSSLNGMSCKQLSDAYMASSGKPWTPPIGFTHGMLEGAIEALKRSEDPTTPEATAKSIASMDLQTIIGRIKFNQDNVPPYARKNVCRTSIAGGQWRLGADGKFNLVTVDNQTAPEVPLGGKMEPLA
jgi:branched-chain amino acid transport system substrate-binding protein